MGRIKVYTPLLQMKQGKRDAIGQLPIFTVNGSTAKTPEEAIRKASKHVSLRDNEAIILKMEEELVWEDEFDRGCDAR